jgi:hypothetical protein
MLLFFRSLFHVTKCGLPSLHSVDILSIIYGDRKFLSSNEIPIDIRSFNPGAGLPNELDIKSPSPGVDRQLALFG